jgi:hypothetical protein
VDASKPSFHKFDLYSHFGTTFDRRLPPQSLLPSPIQSEAHLYTETNDLELRRRRDVAVVEELNDSHGMRVNVLEVEDPKCRREAREESGREGIGHGATKSSVVLEVFDCW